MVSLDDLKMVRHQMHSVDPDVQRTAYLLHAQWHEHYPKQLRDASIRLAFWDERQRNPRAQIKPLLQRVAQQHNVSDRTVIRAIN